MFRPQIETADEVLNRAFELAYFILGDRPASIYVAMAAMDKLKVALTNQSRRLSYIPVGRASYPAARTKVNLSEIHLLQQLVYIESELFERLIEGQRKTIHQEDLIIRYIKHLIRITTKHNSFYVTLGLCRLLYNYSTAETSDIYNLVLQDPDRIRDDYYYRARKKHLMQEIKDRFGGLLRTQRGLRREERFQPQEDSRKYSNLVKQCLIRFSPWQSACVLPKDVDPNRNVIRELVFEGGDPDEEHEVELNRIHTLIHPECLQRLTVALGFDHPDERLELPVFFISSEGARPMEDRFHPTELTAGELDAIRHYLDKNTVHRKQFSLTQLRLLVDGRPRRDFEISPSRSIKLDLDDGSQVIEVRSLSVIEKQKDTSLAICLLRYDQSGVIPVNSGISLGNGSQISLMVSPLTDASGEARGATLEVGYEQTVQARANSRWMPDIAGWRETLTDLSVSSRVRFLKPALALLVVFLFVGGFWFYLESRRRNPSEIAQLKTTDQKDGPGLLPPAPNIQTEPAAPRREFPRRPTTAASPGQRASDVAGDRTKQTERVRGTKPKPAAPLLLAVKRIYVDPLGDDPFSRRLRQSLLDTLRANNRFSVVDSRDDADAVFRAATDKKSQPGTQPTVVLDLVNIGGQVIWSVSVQNESDPATASSKILERLLLRIEKLKQQR
jgi:hypothetical protein